MAGSEGKRKKPRVARQKLRRMGCRTRGVAGSGEKREKPRGPTPKKVCHESDGLETGVLRLGSTIWYIRGRVIGRPPTAKTADAQDGFGHAWARFWLRRLGISARDVGPASLRRGCRKLPRQPEMAAEAAKKGGIRCLNHRNSGETHRNQWGNSPKSFKTRGNRLEVSPEPMAWCGFGPFSAERAWCGDGRRSALR